MKCANPECEVEFEKVVHNQIYHDIDCKRRHENARKRVILSPTPPIDPEAELAHLKHELERMRRVVHQQTVAEGWQQDLIARCVSSIVALPPSVPYTPPAEAKKYRADEDAVLLLSDTHLGEVISAEETGGLGHYDFDTFIARMEYLADGVRNFLTKNMAAHRFGTLHIFMLGDMVSGMIHEEIEATNELHIVDQVFAGALIFAQMFRELAAEFPHVEVTCIVGNHGRIKSKPYFKHKMVNWDFVLYEVLAAYLTKTRNITFDIPRSFLHVKEVRGHRFVLMHGDGIKSALSIPLYGVNRRAANLTEILGTFDYLCMGHFHELAQLKSWKGERIINGSTKGADEFALMLGLASEPVQLLFGVHDKYGKSWSLPLNLRHAHDKPSRYTYDPATPPHKQI